MLVSLKFSFFPPSFTPFLRRFPPGCAGQHQLRLVCETVSTRRGLPRCDIIENKIRTHLLLGQSYPCCQSRCHTHTTLTSTPKSDIVCWNRPSLWLFSRAYSACCWIVPHVGDEASSLKPTELLKFATRKHASSIVRHFRAIAHRHRRVSSERGGKYTRSYFSRYI